MLKKISIIGGGGTVGSTTAFCLGINGICEEIVLYDIAEGLTLHHAYDIGCAICKTSPTRIVPAKSAVDIVGSDVVIVAASFPAASVEAASKVHGQMISALADLSDILKEQAPEAVVLTLSNPVDLINTILWKMTGKPAKQFLGFSLNDSIRLDMAVAEYTGCAPDKVQSFCVGEHGFSKVPVLSSVKIEGTERSFSDEEAEKISEIATGHWMEFLKQGVKRTAGWSTGAYVCLCVDAIAGIHKEPLECSVVLSGEYGYSGISLGTPVYLYKEGVMEIIELDLSEREKALLRKSYDIVHSGVSKVLMSNYKKETDTV